MHNYYTKFIINIDMILFAILFFLVIIVLLYIMFRSYFEKIYKRRLWNIKKNIYSIISSGDNDASRTSSQVIATVTPKEFLAVEMNKIRDAAFFNADEQKLLKRYFLVPGTIKKMEKIAIKSVNKWRRIEAILMFGYMETEQALNILKKTALEKDKDISYFSVRALARLKTLESAKLLLEIFVIKKHLRYSIASFFDGFPPALADLFIELVEKDEISLRLWGLNLIGRVGAERHIKVIETLMSDPVDEIRAAACECLGKLGDQGVTSSIEKSLIDKSWLVRSHAVMALTKLLGEASIEKIMPLINDSSLTVITSVKIALAANIKNALPYLENIFNGNDNLAKRIAIEALEVSGYIKVILRNVLNGQELKNGQNKNILKSILALRVYGALVTEIQLFDERDKKLIFSELRHIDSIATAEIEKMVICRNENVL